jgi:hypothetical protein
MDLSNWGTNRSGPAPTYNATTGQWLNAQGQALVTTTAQQPGQLSPTGKATDMAASVLAAEMQNWETTYKPVELNLLNQSSLNNPNVLPDAINSATQTAQAENTAMTGVAQQQLASRGITATQGQTTAINRMQNLSGAANVAGAQNRARQNVMTQDELIALGTAPNPNLVQASKGTQQQA